MTDNPYTSPQQGTSVPDEALVRRRRIASYARALAHLTAVAAFVGAIVLEYVLIGDDLLIGFPQAPIAALIAWPVSYAVYRRVLTRVLDRAKASPTTLFGEQSDTQR